MNNYQKVENAKLGEMVTLTKTFEKVPEPINYFAHLTDYGDKRNCILLESADIVDKYGEQSIGTVNPCLKVSGDNEYFTIKALNRTGRYFLKQLKGDFQFCDEITYEEEIIRGRLVPEKDNVEESERLLSKNHFDILRNITFKFTPTNEEGKKHGGLFGALGYDMIDQFEELPENGDDIIGDPDYEMYYVDNLFVMDHKKEQTKIVSNVLITEQPRDEIYMDSIKKMNYYEKYLDKGEYEIDIPNENGGATTTDTSKEKYMERVEKLKDHVNKGDVFQTVLSRTVMKETDLPPLYVYSRLRNINPSPYMFFITTEDDALLGASPEMFLRVEGNGEKEMQVRPIAGTKPRGKIDGEIDSDLDSRYELELKLDPKEQAEHTMLIDLARNDIARVTKTGTRYVDEPLIIEKYSHVQHLVSNVTGKLKDNLDAYHAYLASMNMGTLTGAPKVRAMKLIRKYENTRRGYYGGSVGYITPSGDMDTCIVIRSMSIKRGTAYIRVGAGIVHDSVPEEEWKETNKKAAACLEAISKEDN